MMKIKIVPIIILLSISLVNNIFSQGINFSEDHEGFDQYFLVGTLGYSTSLVKEKLKVEVFGGNWHNTNLGEDIYYISTRGGIKINHERHGGETSRYALEVFDNGASYDFVIHITTAYPSIQIKSWILRGSFGTHTNTEFSISPYDPVGKTNFTSQITITDILMVSNSGNVGIGTTAPNYKLDVLGTIHANEIKVESTGADFVFEPDYNLPTLQEVENFIDQNGHLPDIPSAEEVKADGISLGEMNTKLLQKIEELTLYAIDQQNLIMEQTEEIKKLKEDNKTLKNDLLKEIETIKALLK